MKLPKQPVTNVVPATVPGKVGATTPLAKPAPGGSDLEHRVSELERRLADLEAKTRPAVLAHLRFR